jgi:alanine-synthesizing transaminase
VRQPDLVAALARIKSYLDYGTFTPIQVAAIAALEGPQECVREISDMYEKRRDVLCDGTQLHRLAGRAAEGDHVRLGADPYLEPVPGRSARWPSPRSCCKRPRSRSRPASVSANTATTHVRFGLIENEHRTRQAIRGIKEMFRRESPRQR